MMKDRERHNRLVKERREKLIKLGMCCKCGKHPIHYNTSKRFCSLCLSIARDKAKIYREKFPERVSISKKNSVSKNPEKYRNIKKRFWERNKPKWNIYATERRARILKAIGSFSKAEWDGLLEYYGNKCLRCSTNKRLEADHVIPLSRGGKNSIDNIQPLCRTCNSSKGTKILDFREFGNIIMEWT